jgi:hypothetical protein
VATNTHARRSHMAETRKGALDSTTLGVENLALQKHVDGDAGHSGLLGIVHSVRA